MAKQRKLTKSEERAIDLERDERFAAFETLQAKYHLKPCKGRIQWFDATSGEGMILLDDGPSIYAHFTAFKGINTNNWSYPNERDQGYLSDIGGLPCSVVPHVFFGSGVMATEVELLTSDM